MDFEDAWGTNPSILCPRVGAKMSIRWSGRRRQQVVSSTQASKRGGVRFWRVATRGLVAEMPTL